jgi:hypothetical protein
MPSRSVRLQPALRRWPRGSLVALHVRVVVLALPARSFWPSATRSSPWQPSVAALASGKRMQLSASSIGTSIRNSPSATVSADAGDVAARTHAATTMPAPRARPQCSDCGKSIRFGSLASVRLGANVERPGDARATALRLPPSRCWRSSRPTSPYPPTPIR